MEQNPDKWDNVKEWFANLGWDEIPVTTDGPDV